MAENIENTLKTSNEDDSIDIIALLFKVWIARNFILKIIITFGLIGVMVALTTPNQYEATSMFTPNYSAKSSGSSGLKGLASLAGINIGSMTEGTNEISPMLYGKIVESATFKKELLYAPLKNLGEIKSLRDYFIKELSSSVLSTIKEYTIGLPSKIIGLFKEQKENLITESLDGIVSVSEEDYGYFKIIDGILTLSINDKDGYIEIFSKSKNPQIAAQVAKNAESILQRQIIALKTKSSQELLQYLEEQYNLKKQLLNNAQDKLSNFVDRNLNISRSSFSNKQTRLETELQTATAVFQNIVTQLEQVKLQVAKDTPVFSIIKSVVIPNKKSEPKRSLLVMIWLFLGVVLSIGFVFSKEPIKKVIKEIKAKN
ncbi:subunit length determinant protein [Lutibacter sp. Hel_I_33_5]|uniref:GNVR domain-containing protein n=1 Tax=Lutibacter sp. Hel_I_33_5 TaxID=1566289 RepID=UPI00119E4810|nr:GNVR domain-containing protein [Lutibacter sp. Hel_I_33_5]TVZ55511.1 subunit length determinant protein [Lutibacter sp. Hel_I_33_5]